MNKKKILLTGSHGYIGSNFRKKYKNSFDFILCDKKINRPISKLKLRDISECDYIVHLADNINISKMQKDYSLAQENIDSIVHILSLINRCKKRFKKVPKLIFSSTCQIFNIKNLYGMTKYTQENLIKQFSEKYDYFQYKILRFYNVIGGTVFDKDNDHLLPNIMNSIITGGEFNIYGDENQKRSYVHVELICSRIYNAFFCNEIVETIATKDIYTIKEFIKRIEVIMGRKIRVKKSFKRQGDYNSIYVPKYLFEKGSLDKAINDYASYYGLCKLGEFK